MAFIPTIGQMRQVIKFEIPAKDPDNIGGQLEQYDELYTTRGYFRERRAFRDFSDGKDSMINILEMWCSWRQVLESEISIDLKVIYEARIFGIESFRLVDEKRRLYYFELTEIR
jgi:hypothetical protein